MRLQRTHVDRSPDADNRVRLTGDVTYDEGTRESFWYEVEEQFADYLSTTGNPWLSVLLPIAVSLEEPLKIEGLPVDRTLYENVHWLMDVWNYWYEGASTVPIEAEIVDDTRAVDDGRVASLFSGGVDSFFTFLRHHREYEGSGPPYVEDLLSIGGFDTPLRNADAIEREYARVSKVADELGTGLIYVRTNIRETRLVGDWYSKVMHGPALASMGLLLEKRFRRVLIASTHTYDDQGRISYATHALTDGYLSTRRTHFTHDGAGFNRAAKTRFIVPSKVAMENLQSCWFTGQDENCCECIKCYLTMMALELFGALDRCPRFAPDVVDLSKVEHLLIEDDFQRTFLQEIHDLALWHKRPDMAEAIEKAFKRSRAVCRRAELGQWLTTKPVLWRLVPPLRRRIHKMEAESIRQPEPEPHKLATTS